MRLSRDDALGRAAHCDHGVLCTLHPARGVDAVPVCFALDGLIVAVPIDAVKPKSSRRLQRTANLDADPRATLLCERWDRHDWSRLWWVRLSLIRTSTATTSPLEAHLRAKYPQYRDAAFSEVLSFDVVAVSGWSAT